MSENLKSVLITGTSSGIGRACAIELEKKGYRVFATVRNEKDARKLKEETSGNVVPVVLDVTNTELIKNAYKTVSEIVGENGLYALINNAGIAVGSPLEFVPVEQIRYQFEVNVIGQIVLTQTFLPLIRKGKGRIINIGSNNGIISIPFLGVYCATKFSMESITDCFRMELKKWGITVSIIDPYAVQTSIWEKCINATLETFNKSNNDAHLYYRDTIHNVLKTAVSMGKNSPSAEIVVKTICHALTTKEPKARYFPGLENKFLYFISKFIGKKTLDRIICKQMGAI